MRIFLCLIGCVAILASSCSKSSTPPPQRIVTNAADLSFCCNPNAEFPLKVGEFQVQIIQGEFSDLDPDTIAATFTSTITAQDDGGGAGRHTLRSPIVLSVASGSPLELGSTTIEVVAQSCYFSEIDVTFLADVSGRRIDDLTLTAFGIRKSFKITNTCPPLDAPPSPPQLMIEAIVGDAVADFDQYGLDVPVGVPTNNPSSMAPPQVPTDDFTEAFQVGWFIADLTQQQLDDAFVGDDPVFPLGESENGLTLPAEYPLPMPTGQYLIAWQCVVGDIPRELDGRFMQFAFVFDRDRDPQNNYTGQEPFDLDPFNDTDTWCSAQYDSFSGWYFALVDAQQDPPYSLDSGARMILYDQVQMFVVPVAELGDPADVLARFTTFVHDGDFGLSGGEWSGDASPPIDQPLLTVTIDAGS